ncbi:hypothetical protein Gbro_0403 [Gordonia bronchialis DSM 43247]|uniref:Uncharacterized protein n=1 Tax=Gordonia bronchialis (strain ATCC 25592 / DSM 43247 / BCRC 13721 / JCM 3198 / KCTC 3076 / NBRC 16047 / NCTC 10667) TaxID=526226 RepID=D0LDB7_GORB4|nr:WXG100 family type VII secretion target [Gordonia bronchialis]ACY19737.1 hypothetical protein Gbro_0403 [Gordonia bronchialis DSM 43247]MCC3322513.1 WXG100 family type VII secretion target [Gordonia bronchialis]QGS26372.1 hypothetical protein FOB84_21815 [Gordonia bronchialis]STQ62508.1 WXG100 family type VII secretion target [Gordonia bronchialis]
MSADHVEVEPAQLWATARALSAINDLSHTTLRDQDGVLATCAAGWATRSAVGYADFTTQLADFTAALSSRLDHLESTTRAAAARYENTDNDSARRIATAIEGTLNL